MIPGFLLTQTERNSLRDNLGQINRHRNQQSGIASAPAHHPPRRHRHVSAPYPQRGRPQRTHQHRTLHFNAAGVAQNSSATSSSAGSNASRWVAKNDRHRQLINANVYEKESQSRAKAIEETRKRKQNGQRRGERDRFNKFLMHHQAAPEGTTNSDVVPVTPNEIKVDGIRFRVLAGGKKLARIPGMYFQNIRGRTSLTTTLLYR